jgi:DHA1 family bicyclomycin/chloramphenicol resistance-like MFS transporter
MRLSVTEQLSRYLHIVRERSFITHAAMGGCGSFAMFAYLAGSSPVFIEGFGLSPLGFAMIFGSAPSAW